MKNFLKNIFTRYQVVEQIELSTRLIITHELDAWRNVIVITTQNKLS